MNYEEVIAKATISKVVGKSIDKIYRLFKEASKDILQKARTGLSDEEFELFEKDYDLELSEDRVLKMISNNIKSTFIWSSEIDFSAALKSKQLEKVFVDLDLYLSPLKDRFDQFERTKKIKRKTLLKDFSKNKVIYGGAGAGKTTLIKKICTELFDELDFQNFSCLIVIRFREIDYLKTKVDEEFGLYDILINELGIQIKFPHSQLDNFRFEYRNILKQTVITFLEENKILLIADGFDEIPNNDLKKQIEREFNQLAVSLNHARFILTSRNNDFILRLPNTHNYEICPLSDTQIKAIVKKWLVHKDKVEDLYDKIRNSPYYDTTMRPLTLSHLCAIYERRQSIPPKPRYIYDFVMNLLIEMWDQQRNVIRPSKYANFYIEKKKEFLAHLSFFMSYHMERNVFTSEELKICYNKIYRSHNLPKGQSKKVVMEIENHTGLLVQVGYNTFQFSHKSLQEFLTAKHINSQPQIPIYSDLPNEMAIAACLSSSPNYFFKCFIHLFKKLDDRFWNVFLNRLVDESPDFDEDPSAIVFFLMATFESENKVFETSFKKLMAKTNLGIAIKPFLRIYKKGEINEDLVGFDFHDIQIPLDKRDYYPARLFARSNISYLIYN